MKKFAAILLVAALSLTGCGKNTEPAVTLPPVAEPAVPAPEPEPEPVETCRLEICRFTGREIPEGSALERPVLVIYDNVRPARPPAGLKEAGFVYEIPVEGAITRFLAVFTHSFPGAIGPVRSARPYFVTLALEHGGILAHCGFSPRAQIMLQELKVAHINELTYSQYYFRDSTRKAPHNLYTGMDLLVSGAEKLKYLPSAQKAAPVFRNGEAEYGTGEAVAKVTLNYSTATWADYLYDKAGGLYLRYMEGDRHTDAEGSQLAAKNLIVQFVNITAEEPGSERLDIALVGQGTGYYFVNGRAYPLAWHKKTAASPTQYLLDGKELVLAPGTTWIHYVDARNRSNVTFN